MAEKARVRRMTILAAKYLQKAGDPLSQKEKPPNSVFLTPKKARKKVHSDGFLQS
jgi:hypothetical protein